MLRSLKIRNYALISNLEIEFREGLNMITGETGAGKSILLGALGMLLGNRADTQILRDKDQKCHIEAEFEVSRVSLKPLFEANDLDWEPIACIRREITPQGKSRAFINDTPVTLTLLREMGIRLVDIHSQHQNLMLGEEGYALHVIDRFGGLQSMVEDYSRVWLEMKETDRELTRLRKALEKAREDQDYLEFQLAQLEQAQLSAGELEDLEQEQERLEHAGDIQYRLGEAVQILHETEDAVETRLKQVISGLQAVTGYMPALQEPLARLQSVYLEIQETSRELRQDLDHAESNPERLTQVIERIDLINNLLRKHHVTQVSELLALREQYRNQLEGILISDEEYEKLSGIRKRLEAEVLAAASSLTEARRKVIPGFEEKVVSLARALGMPNASFRSEFQKKTDWDVHGADEIRFLFSANKNQLPEELSRVASGGETSRLMLSIKSLIADSLDVPTVIFDEIDAGVSGEIADKVGNMIVRLSHDRQILNITHLPQIASKGDFHYLVYKYDDDQTTHTTIRQLTQEERVTELAKMLSGERLTPEAIQNARALLNR